MIQDSEHVIFIDNEKVFKSALARADYDEYFYDASTQIALRGKGN